jgi:hypothetical protein
LNGLTPAFAPHAAALASKGRLAISILIACTVLLTPSRPAVAALTEGWPWSLWQAINQLGSL